MQHAHRNAPKNAPEPHWLQRWHDEPSNSGPDKDSNRHQPEDDSCTRHAPMDVAADDAACNKGPLSVASRTKPIKPSGGTPPTSPTQSTKTDPQAVRRRPTMLLKSPVVRDSRLHLTVDMHSWHSRSNGQAAKGGSKASTTPEPEPLSKFEEIRQELTQSMTQLRTVLKAMRAPLPTQTGDGSTLPAVDKPSTIGMLREIVSDLGAIGPSKLQDVAKVFITTAEHGTLNDREYYMERLIQATALLPNDAVSTKLTDGFLTTLWNDLSHPPRMLLSHDYQYRQPDGSKNNYMYPHIGAANMPYARTVTPKTQTPCSLPDPGLLFDATLARKNPKGTPHPNKISSMLFYLASIIIHDCFKTDHTDFYISKTSSYLDLAPLYGSTWAEQKRMRTFKDGKIKPDCFSEPRLLTFPPGVGALLIMFNRYHNYVVEQLALINENERFTETPKKVSEERYGEQVNIRDDNLFQTARLITCGLYVNIILIDYVRTILNLNRTDENWQLDPRVDIPGGVPQGTGNQVAAEFNLVYRWHAAISNRDDEWTQQLFKEISPDMTPAEAAKPQNIVSFLKLLGHMEYEFSQKEPQERQWPALKSEVLERIKEGPYAGSFKDDDLAAILTAGIEDCANSYGPQQIPTVMKVVEILGIQQARTWKVATLNEFRKHFGLDPHHTFDDITHNKEVANALKHLYDTPDNVELYPGLVVEDGKPPMVPGSGLCPGYTVSRGVLSDAVALVRGDRFYTFDYTPASLTNWGYQEASFDTTIDNGCVLYKLFLRGLPNNYDPASVYVHYPFTIPQEMKLILTDLKKADKYNFDKPTPISQPTIIWSYDAATKIMNNKENFRVTWGPAMEFLMGPAAKNFMLAGDGSKNAASRKLMESVLYQGDSSRAIPKGNEKWLKAVQTFYEKTTIRLLKERSYTLAGKQYVDIIRDVGNMAHVYFCSELFSLPLKTQDQPWGIITEHQMYMIMAAVFIAIFFDVDPPKSFPLRQQAKDAVGKVGEFVELLVGAIAKGGSLAEVLAKKLNPVVPELGEYGVHMIKKLTELDTNVTDLVWGNIMGTAGGMVANQGQLFGQALDWFFSTPEGVETWPKVCELAKMDTEDADEKLMHYFMEASRLNGETGVMRWVQTDTPIEIIDTPSTADDKQPLGSKTYTFKQGDKIMVNLKAASRDPKAFPNPDAVDPTRPLDSYIHLGHGPHQCLGLPMTRVALTTMLKVIASLPKLQPAPVSIGGMTIPSKVKKVVKEFVPGDSAVVPEAWHYHEFLTEDWEMYFPFPASLKVCFEGEVPTAKTA